MVKFWRSFENNDSRPSLNLAGMTLYIPLYLNHILIIAQLVWSQNCNAIKGELYSNYILLYFGVFGLELDSITLFTKTNFFFLPKLTLQHHLHKIYMAFYLLTWTYFNDVNGSRNILMNSQLKRILFMSSDKKKWNKTEKDRNDLEKK